MTISPYTLARNCSDESNANDKIIDVLTAFIDFWCSLFTSHSRHMTQVLTSDEIHSIPGPIEVADDVSFLNSRLRLTSVKLTSLASCLGASCQRPSYACISIRI